MYKRLGTAMLGIAAALTIGACSPPHEQPSDQPPGAEQLPTTLEHPPEPVQLGKSEPATAATSTRAGECTVEDIKVSGSFGQQPKVTIPRDCTAPSPLLSADLKEGNGPKAAKGSTVKVRYQVVMWSNGKVVDGNFDGGQLFPVRNLGEANVIEAWNKGLVGIKEGGRRLLVVPPEMAYGKAGSGSIGPNETLVFVIDAVSVQQA